MFKLEHELQDKSKSTKLMPTLRELEDAKSDWKDDYSLNSLMRGVLRVSDLDHGLDPDTDLDLCHGLDPDRGTDHGLDLDLDLDLDPLTFTLACTSRAKRRRSARKKPMTRSCWTSGTFPASSWSANEKRTSRWPLYSNTTQ